MGFRQQKQHLIKCLNEGNYQHEQRSEIEIKNLLATGQVSEEVVCEVVKASSGNDFEARPHHSVSSVDVYIITKKFDGKDWYIKWYVIDPGTIFISVHH